MECHCGAVACRGIVTGTDWMRADLQERYRDWFSWWLQQKIGPAVVPSSASTTIRHLPVQ